MGTPKRPKPVNLICAITFREGVDLSKVEAVLMENFSPIDLSSKPYNFSEITNYYHKEMGYPLIKYIVSFSKIVELEEPHLYKIKTNEIESMFLEGTSRTVNLDIGYLNESQVVLFSTKGYFHRVYLGKGIYAEVTLYFKNKSFRPFEWTYRDYRLQDTIDFLNKVRENYRIKLRNAS